MNCYQIPKKILVIDLSSCHEIKVGGSCINPSVQEFISRQRFLGDIADLIIVSKFVMIVVSHLRENGVIVKEAKPSQNYDTGPDDETKLPPFVLTSVSVTGSPWLAPVKPVPVNVTNAPSAVRTLLAVKSTVLSVVPA
jgi:hypothetical protein